MPELMPSPDLAAATERRAGVLFEEHRRGIFERTDRLFAKILVFEWVLGIVLAVVVSPRAWAGSVSRVHPHLLAALLLGGAIVSLPVMLAIRQPGRALTRHVIAGAQMLVSALLIHLTGGRIETHFHVFGSLAFLAFYRDWKVFIPATLVVALDHLLRGLLWPQSVYGVLEPGGWRWLEHSGWVLFEDTFLVISCLQSVQEMRGIAARRAQLEATNEIVERAVTERTRELAESEERFEAFMDNSPAVVFMKDPDGRYVHVNRTFERAFGRPREEVAGRTDRELWTAEVAAALEAADGRARSAAGSLETTDSLPVAGGRVHQWTVYRFVLGDGRGRQLLGGIALDVTEKLVLAEKMRQSNRMEAVGRLAGGIAHDFNNLLTAITGYAQLLLGELAPEDARRGYADEIAHSSERAAALTQQLLAFSRKQMLQPKVLDMNQVVSGAEGLLHRLMGANVQVVASLDAGLDPVRADVGQLEQVIVNLALNARDAMPHGGRLTLETRNVELGPDAIGPADTAPPSRYALLAISDTGTGMDAETSARVFEPFFTTKGLGKATGLGLSTVHGIVHQSGGRVLVYSEVGIGTTFKIYLPAQMRTVVTPDSASPTPASGSSEVVLLVEDEDTVRRMIQQVLERQGYEVIVARNGEEAIEVARPRLDRIDLVLTDVVMTGMSGRQLAERLAEQRPGLRVLFMSGYAEDAIVHHGVLDPGIDFILKPFVPKALSLKVREVLDRREAA
jgi:PAS domain S-box-containing protein